MIERLDPYTFDLSQFEIGAGKYSATYFNRTRKVLKNEKPDLVVTMQVFQKAHSILCGIDEAIAILQKGTILSEDVEIRALHDGDEISPWEPVLTIRGPLAEFCHLESVYLGVLARQTKVATNTRRVVDAANSKPVLFFADRFDDYHNQPGDGYAAHIGGASDVATDAMGRWFGGKGVGTMPHALIAAYDGDVVQASAAFKRHNPEVDLIALVDFNNDCVSDSLRCLKAFGSELKGVRLDTSENMVDVSITHSLCQGDFKPIGVNPPLVRLVRAALDANGGKHVRIIVSGGFNPEKIAMFEKVKAPVDAYAVGSSLLQGSIDFTADCVNPVAKAGRWERDASRLELVTR